MSWRAVGLGLAGGFGVLCALANRSAFFPMRFPEGEWDQQAAAGAQDVWITPRLHAWWKPAPEARCATLFLHGNAGNVTHRAPAMIEIAAAGSSVLVPDYRGYGRSSGWPTESGVYDDARLAWRHLLAQGFAPNRIILHGESLGTAVAVRLASEVRPAGIILEAPFPSARAVAARVLPGLGPLLVWGFDSRSRVGLVRAPLLFIQGDRDEVIDYSLGRALYDAAPQPKEFWTVPGAHHNDIQFAAGPAYRERLRLFMINACAAALSSPSQP
ncbi:MAG: alpha/beta hydrolase [Acidobacteria bacterium]|nr:alpha/beta hydrolase [Acidobacteriota bacterium]